MDAFAVSFFLIDVIAIYVSDCIVSYVYETEFLELEGMNLYSVHACLMLLKKYLCTKNLNLAQAFVFHWTMLSVYEVLRKLPFFSLF